MSRTGIMLCRDKLFWDKVKQEGPDDCWPWLASTNKDGYGQFWIGYTFVPAHRYAYVFKYQQRLSEGILICHHCDNPACCNPNHLFEGTVKDNVSDKMRKGRHGDPTPINPAKGSSHGMATLQESDVLKIRYIASNGTPQIEIARTFGVSAAQISAIIKRKYWRHI